MKKDFDIDSKFSKKILHSITESLYASGIFTDDDIKDKESHVLALKRLLDNGSIGGITVDYTQSLTAKARRYKNSNELDYSRIFYATYFEHEVNGLIHLYCLRNKIDNNTQTAIIQSVNIWGKFTWLLQLMNYPIVNKNHLNTIKALADSRNSFVHYKWKDDPDFHSIPDSKKEQDKIDSEFDRIEKAVKYFRKYCSKIMFKGNKSKIKKLI